MPRRSGSPLRLAVVAGAVALFTGGCSLDAVERGWMPGDQGLTSHTDIITRLWTGSWIAALIVGLMVWGLILWCVVVYRRRRADEPLPDQLRYHVPLEIMYTAIPFMIIGVLFFYTARDQAIIESIEEDPDHTIEVIGKQWSWDFNYLDEDVFNTGIQVDTPDPLEEQIPTLYLPVDQEVRIIIRARDVIHSWWVPNFLYKKDMIPGRTNFYQFTPQETGTFIGKCAEFCGEYHSAMLFNVAVVEQEEYEDHIEELRDRGQEGRLEVDLGRSDLQEGEQIEDEIGTDRGGQEDQDGADQ